MKADWDGLRAKCPNLYRNLVKLGGSYPFFFEVEDGWFDLIAELSEKLEALIMQEPEGERPNYYCDQCKTKFASLRFYMSSETLAMTDLIREAESKSRRLCECCGSKGSLRGSSNGWLYVECDRCELLK